MGGGRRFLMRESGGSGGGWMERGEEREMMLEMVGVGERGSILVILLLEGYFGKFRI